MKNIITKILFASLLMLVFTLGWLIRDTSIIQISSDSNNLEFAKDPIFSSQERFSPKDRISEDQIHVYDDYIMLDIKNAEWARFSDTNSMDPVFDAGHNAIEIVPKKASEIQVGDVISYNSPLVSGTVIHRVTKIGNDGEWFAKVKGDNNAKEDPGKVRFDQIERVLIAIIY